MQWHSLILLSTISYHNIKMGNCVTSQPQNSNHDNVLKAQTTTLAQQTEILSLIYKDLSERIVEKQLNLENFLLFSKKNRYWGERLFEKFPHDGGKLVNQTNFVEGALKIFKANEQQKLHLLFELISQGEKNKQEGITSHDFLTMLYNCPKEDLKTIINDREFIEEELKSHLVPISSDQDTKGKLNCYELQSTNASEIKRYVTGQELSNSRSCHHSELPSLIGREVTKSLITKQRNHESIICLNCQGQEMNIKALNIQQLAKMFVQRIFRKANIDIKTGKLSFKQFEEWICNHTALYKNYYQSFHNEIWQTDSYTLKPKFISQPSEKDSDAKLLVQDQLIKVKLHLFNSILMACKSNDLEHPLIVICLDGLSVRRIFEETIGFGIEVSHREGYYQDKKIFFDNENILLEWLQSLQLYQPNELQNRYQLGDVIGKGKFSTVSRCINLQDQQQYALKQIQTYKLSEEQKTLIAQQTCIMKVFSHPLLLSFKESIRTKTHTYIITDLVKGINLWNYVHKKDRLRQPEAAKLFQQIIVGVRFLHSFDIVHRDLKPENIMVVLNESTKEAENIEIIDFGLSNYLSKLHSDKSLDNMVGTPNYIAPQILKDEPFDFKIDNFAMGVILYFMLTGNLPFLGNTISQTLENIISGYYGFSSNSVVSKQAQDLVEKLLKSNPHQRISLEQALQHQWFNILDESSSSSY